MSEAVYRIVEHDGGWAYTLDDVFSETFASRADAETAARRVAAEQRSPGEDEAISWQDDDGRWHDEIERGTDRPDARVSTGAEDPTFEDRRGRSLGRAAIDQVRGVYDRGDEYSRKGLKGVRERTRVNPLAALALAGVCGCALALALKRRR